MDICHGSDLSVPQVVDGAVEVGGLADRGDDQGPVDLTALKTGQAGAQTGHLLEVGSLASCKYPGYSDISLHLMLLNRTLKVLKSKN